MNRELLKSIEDKYSESTIELEYQSISISQECKEAFISGYTQAEKDLEEKTKAFIEKWEEQKSIWKSILENKLFHPPEHVHKASQSVLTINAMLCDFKRTYDIKEKPCDISRLPIDDEQPEN